jgi:integrase
MPKASKPAERRNDPGGRPVINQYAFVYINERRDKGEFTRQTADRVWYCLADFGELFGRRPMTHLTPVFIDRWLASHPLWKPGTRRTHFGQVRAFCRWLLERGVVKKDPFAGRTAPKRPRKNPRPLSREQFQILFHSLPDSRARLIVSLEYWLGLRAVEVSRLQVEDIDRSHNLIHVIGKGGHERTLPLVPQCQLTVNTYLREHPATSGPLLRSYTRPGGLTPGTVSIIVRGWLKDCGLKETAFDGITPHAMRHSALTELAEATRDPYLVMELAGHSDVSTAMHYVRRADTAKLREALSLRVTTA